MAKHIRRNESNELPQSNSDKRAQLNDHAARASAMLANRQTRGAAPRPSARSGADASNGRGQQKSLGTFFRRNFAYIIGVVLVVVAATIGIFGVRALLNVSKAPQAETVERMEEYVSPYDWANLKDDGGRLQYVVDGQVRSRLGIDVSEHEGDIDWEAVAEDGVEFVMVRLGNRGATEGELYLDDRFWDNFNGVKEAGLDRGVYFFSQAITVEEAIEEADFVLSTLNGESLQYPIAFDHEESVGGVLQSRSSEVSDDEMTAIMEAFCARVEAAGYRSLVYGNTYDLARFNYSSLKQKDVWWAQYTAPAPTAKLDIVMWQFTGDGSVNGVPGGVDMNIDLSRVFD